MGRRAVAVVQECLVEKLANDCSKHGGLVMQQRIRMFVRVCVALLFVFSSAHAAEQDLCTGVGACNRPWMIPAGDIPWAVQTPVSHDGINALMSLPSSGGQSSVETSITGPTTVSFWWKVEPAVPAISGEGITFLVDDVGVTFNSSTEWSKFTHSISLPGPHSLKWAFFPSLPGGSGVLDQFLVEETVVPTGSMAINSGASVTKTGNVTLSLTYEDGDGSGVTKMRFSNNGSTWSGWENPADSKSWALTTGDGNRTVRAQFRDKAGNVSAVYTDYIKVDGTPPTGSVLINAGAPSTSNPVVSLGLTGLDGTGSGVTRMRFSIDGKTWGAWESFAATRAYTLPATPAYYTVRVQFRDRAENVSSIYSDYIHLLAP
jgi:hypothetical protein